MNEKTDELVKKGEVLPLMEAFYTLQGEGKFTGTAAYFIRIGGCDVGCHWCDVKESWNPDIHPPTHIDDIVEEAKKYSRTIVITGGEPLMWNLEPLTSKLKENGFTIHLETSGAYPFSGNIDWVCLSPKKNMPPLEEIYLMADELKVIIYNQNDFKWAEDHAKKVKSHCELYLQPEWSKREKMIPDMVEYVMQNPQWKIGLQTHKYLHIP